MCCQRFHYFEIVFDFCKDYLTFLVLFITGESHEQETNARKSDKGRKSKKFQPYKVDTDSDDANEDKKDLSTPDSEFEFRNNKTDHRNPGISKKMIRCDLCEKRFSSKIKMLTHRRTHTGLPILQCEFCHKSFAHSSLLLIHRRSHTGEKPFKCKYCDVTFAQKSNLILHHRTHTGEKPFKCDMCNKTFGRKYHLKNHIFTVHKIVNEGISIEGKFFNL